VNLSWKKGEQHNSQEATSRMGIVSLRTGNRNHVASDSLPGVGWMRVS
jgi:hypothetical protein